MSLTPAGVEVNDKNNLLLVWCKVETGIVRAGNINVVDAGVVNTVIVGINDNLRQGRIEIVTAVADIGSERKRLIPVAVVGDLE